MEIELFERTALDNDRAVQLINKTNQFNSNGNRISKQNCDQLIDGQGLVRRGKIHQHSVSVIDCGWAQRSAGEDDDDENPVGHGTSLRRWNEPNPACGCKRKLDS